MSSGSRSTSEEPSPQRKRSSKQRSSKKRKRSSRKNEISEKSRPIWLWVFIGVICVLVIGAVVYDRNGNSKNTGNANGENGKQDSFKTLLYSSDFDAISKANEEIIVDAKRQSFPVVSELLTKRIKLASRAREIAKTEVQREWADLNYLQDMVRLESYSLSGGLKRSEFHEELKQTLESFETHSNPGIALKADISSLLMAVHDLIRDSNWKSQTTKVKEKFAATLKRHPTDREFARGIQGVYLLLHADPKYLTLENEIVQMLGEHYASQTDPELIELGERLIVQKYLNEYRINTIEESFIIDAKKAATQLHDAIDEVIQKGTAPPALLNRLVGSCNILEVFDQRELAIVSGEKILAAATVLNGKRANEAVKNAEALLVRCRAIGKTLVIDETDLAGKKVDSSTLPNLPIVVGFIPSTSQRFQDVLKVLGELKTRYQGKAHFIVVALDGDEDTIVRKAALAGFQSGIIADTKRESGLFRQFPVTIAHSFLLVDKNRKISDLVVDDVLELNDKVSAMVSSETE